MKEWQFQIAVVTYVRLQFPKALLIHPVNEGKRSAFSGGVAKKMGMVPGTPDLLFLENMRGYKGMAMELKVGKNPPSQKQLEQLEIYQSKGWSCHVVRDIDSAIKLIDWYLK